MTLFPLPEGISWWVVQSRRHGREGPFRTWDLCWGVDEAEVAANLAREEAALDRSLRRSALRRGEIADEAHWQPPSTLIEHERMIRVSTIDDVEALDPGLAAMLREHDGFVDEFEAAGPAVVGGSVMLLPTESGA